MIQFLHRKESVILTAIEIIDELGIQGLSTREIAKRQGISEGTLFRHFHSKNEIILAVLEYFSQYDADIFESVRLKGLQAKAAIIFLVDTYVTYYENYPAITAVIQIYGVLASEPDFAAKMRNIRFGRLHFLRDVIERGQKDGELKASVACSILADIIAGTFLKICMDWRMSGHKFSLREKTLAAIMVVLDVFGQEKVDELGERK